MVILLRHITLSKLTQLRPPLACHPPVIPCFLAYCLQSHFLLRQPDKKLLIKGLETSLGFFLPTRNTLALIVVIAIHSRGLLPHHLRVDNAIFTEDLFLYMACRGRWVRHSRARKVVAMHNRLPIQVCVCARSWVYVFVRDGES